MKIQFCGGVMDNGHDFVLGNISFEILSAAFEVHNTLGPGFLEKVYENALNIELKKRNFYVESQKEINVFYKGTLVGSYYADLLVDGEVIVELKSIETLTKVHDAQLLNYLRATRKKLGLLINFGRCKVEHRRFVM
jgi:GxxExxY protein